MSAEIHPRLHGEDSAGARAANSPNVMQPTDTRTVAELQAELRALERQTRVFDTALSSIADFAYLFDKEGRFAFANRALANFLQRTPESMVGKSFSDLGYPRALAEKLQRQIREVFETKEIVRDETPFVSPAGEAGYYEYIFRPVSGADGSVETVVGSTRDITERKRAEEAFRESEQRFRAMFEQAHVGIAQIATNGEFIAVNPGACAIGGYAEEELLGMKADDVTYPDDLPREQELTRKLLQGEIPDFTLEKRYVRKDGDIVWANMTATLVRDAAGNPLYILAIVEAIGERKKVEERLRGSEELYRLLVEGTPDYAMFLLDPENRITYWSAGAEKVFGWGAKEAIGKTGELIFTPEDRAQGAVERELGIARAEGAAPDRRWHLRKDGSRFWADGVMRRVDGNDGELRGFAKIARDASDQRRIEDELRYARDEFEQRVVERTSDLMATNNELERTMAQRAELERELLEISEREKRRIGDDLHDMVCQELTATALFLKSSATKLAKTSPDASATLNESAQIVNRNVGLTRDLARGLQPAELHASGLREALKALATRACETSEIKCHFKAARGVRVKDDTVALHLYRITQEAVNNAIKHSGAKNILIVLDRNEEHVCVTVEDDGKGLKLKKREKGLGLHIMRYRANALGGKLVIERRKRGGTEVRCVIPAK